MALRRMITLILMITGLVFYSSLSFAAIGCKIPGVNTIYPNSSYYLLGVRLSSGAVVGVGQDIYNLTNPIYTTVSCTVPWANFVSAPQGTCIYGSPAVAVPLVVAACTNCVVGDLVTYTTTLECDLDDQLCWFGFVFIASVIFYPKSKFSKIF